ncbi:MAG: hypothetical protein ABI467_15960 [Kofleriaceae bacterium]
MLGKALACLLVVGATAHANPASLVPGGIDAGDRIDAVGTVDYEYEQDTSTVWRESVHDPDATPTAPLPLHRDLAFHQFKHTVTPRLDIGLVRDTWFSVALPVTITQTRELRLDQGVDRTGSSTVVDGLLPAAGFDARDPSTPPSGDLMYRGVDRHGIDQIQLGLGFAPMNQHRDDTKPTWKIGAELRLAVGQVMKLDPAAPTANSGVGAGVHELRLWTSFDRKLDLPGLPTVEPWFEVFWQVPIGTTNESLFQNPGFGATNTAKSQTAGVQFGVEAYAIDNAADRNRISLDLGTKVVAHFEGRDYSEMWEVLAGNSALALDADPTMMGVQPLPYPGISNIENYLETRAKIALRAELGPHVRLSAGTDIIWKTDHSITFADAGVDLPTCGAGQTAHCETSNNDVINAGTEEVNPLHAGKIDLVGHRYQSQDNFGIVIAVSGEVIF